MLHNFGGVSIFGGVGRIWGAVLGAVMVYLLSVAMIYLGFQDYYQFAVQGAIILIAVYITVADFEKVKKLFRKSGPGTPQKGEDVA